jgi:hypothetical protein
LTEEPEEDLSDSDASGGEAKPNDEAQEDKQIQEDSTCTITLQFSTAQAGETLVLG